MAELIIATVALGSMYVISNHSIIQKINIVRI